MFHSVLKVLIWERPAQMFRVYAAFVPLATFVRCLMFWCWRVAVGEGAHRATGGHELTSKERLSVTSRFVGVEWPLQTVIARIVNFGAQPRNCFVLVWLDANRWVSVPPHHHVMRATKFFGAYWIAAPRD